MIVNVNKAMPIGTHIAPNTTIVIEHPIREVGTLTEAAKLYNADAKLIFNALRGSLPGGTFDRLTVLMLREKASLLAVPHFKVEQKEKTNGN